MLSFVFLIKVNDNCVRNMTSSVSDFVIGLLI